MSAQHYGNVYIGSADADEWKTVAVGSPMMDKSVVVNFCNQTGGTAEVSLAYVVDPLASEPTPAEVMLNLYPILGRQFHKTSAIMLVPNGRLMVRSKLSGVSVQAYGYSDPL